jgi:hypothetical protein
MVTKGKGEWKKVGGGDFPPAFIFDKEGAACEGVLAEKKMGIKTKDGERNVYVVDTADGKKSVWNWGLLDYQLKEIKEGTMIRIVFLGKKTVEVDGKKRKCNQSEVYTQD